MPNAETLLAEITGSESDRAGIYQFWSSSYLYELHLLEGPQLYINSPIIQLNFLMTPSEE
jgi:hypothetical protein